MRQTGRRAGIRGLIGFEIFIKIACLSFCFPLLQILSDICIKAAGYSYITRENLLSFLLAPLTLVCLAAGLVAVALFILFELNAVNLALWQSRMGIKVTFPGLFYGGIAKTGKILKKKWRGVLLAFLSLLFVLFANLPLAFFLLLGIGQTREAAYVVMQPPGIFILAAVTLLLWWFALFGCSVVLLSGAENGEIQNVFRLGFKRVKQYCGRIFFGLLKRSILLVVTELAVYFVGLVLMIALVLWTTPKTLSAVLLIRTFQRYHFIICILFASVNAVIYEYFCASLFFDKGVTEMPHCFTQEETVPGEECISGKIRLKKVLLSVAFVAVIGLASAEMLVFFRNGTFFLAEALDELCITAHRGASDGAPENTAAAIELAIREAADYVELDVRLTADGVPVLLHDAALFRTTRVPGYIWEVTYAELSEYDAGSSYSKDFAGERIPCLEEVFERYGGEIGFNIELKTSDDRTLAEKVVGLVEQYHLEQSCVITSSSYQQLVWVKELNEELKTGYILSFVYGDFYKSEAADFFSIYAGFISENVVEKAHLLGKEVHAWTINREDDLKRMKAMGVDNIITNKPAYARKIIYGSELTDTIEEWILLLAPKK